MTSKSKNIKITLKDVAYARSGDKGMHSNVGICFINIDIYEWAKENLTISVIKKYYKSIVKGDVIRYELDNLLALNFILKNSLGGGGSETLQNDAQGKTYAQALLMMEIYLPIELYEKK
tara:strand:- start:224 stop:580 length:357 start_codon:yes stop_codon:yes gene_type:complete